MNTLLEIKNVTKYFGSGDAVSKALDGVSFSMDKGEFTAVMGASGSGKSTLLNVIATIDRPSSGSILLEGRDIAGMEEQELAAFRRDRLGFIFQEYNLLDTLTVAENIVLPLNLQKCPLRETEKTVGGSRRFSGNHRSALQISPAAFRWAAAAGRLCPGAHYTTCPDSGG